MRATGNSMPEICINKVEEAFRAWSRRQFYTAWCLFHDLEKTYPGVFSANIKSLNNRIEALKNYNNKKGNFYKVSIIVPVFNNAAYLEQCFNSILSQSLKEIEIIIVNDGSTDPDAIEIINHYAATDSRITLVNKKNSGYGHSVNIGLDLANGEYVGIVESDDYIHASMYEKLYRYAKNNAADVVKCDFARFITHNGESLFETVGINKNDEYYNKVINPEENPDILRMYTLNQNGIYKTSYIRENNISLNETPGASYQDNGLFFQLIMFAKSVFCINYPLYYLRRDNESSSVFSRHKVYASCEEYDFIKKIISKSEYLKEKFLKIFFVKKYGNYQFTLRRISPEYLKDFFTRFYNEFKSGLDKGEFSREDFNEIEWNGLQKLLNKKNEYFRYKAAHPQSLNFLESAKKARDEYLRTL